MANQNSTCQERCIWDPHFEGGEVAVTEPGVWRWGVHENPDLPEAFHERRMHEFANLDKLRDPYFQIVGGRTPTI